MKGRVLLVEDEADARQVLSMALERADWRCVQAADVPSALAALSADSEPLDVAVVDVVLGDKDEGGLELVRPIRAAAGSPAVVVITAFADLSRVKRAMNDGASYLLEKPFRAPELLEVLGRVVGDRDSVSHLVERAIAKAKLTDKEGQIARLLLKGLPTAEIAELQGNSDKTIRQHVSQVYAKCGVSSRGEFFHFVFPT